MVKSSQINGVQITKLQQQFKGANYFRSTVTLIEFKSLCLFLCTIEIKLIYDEPYKSLSVKTENSLMKNNYTVYILVEHGIYM